MTLGSVTPEPGRYAPPPKPPPKPGPMPEPCPEPAPVPGPEPAPPVLVADCDTTPGSVISDADIGVNGTSGSNGGGSLGCSGVGSGAFWTGTEMGSFFCSTWALRGGSGFGSPPPPPPPPGPGVGRNATISILSCSASSGGSTCGPKRMISSTTATIAICVTTDVPAPTLDFALSKPKLYSSGRSSSRSWDPRISSGAFLPVDFAIQVESRPKQL